MLKSYEIVYEDKLILLPNKHKQELEYFSPDFLLSMDKGLQFCATIYTFSPFFLFQ